MNSNLKLQRIAVVVAGLALSGCGEMMKVTNPGLIADGVLDRAEAMPGLVSGMAGDLSLALGNSAWMTALMSDELKYAGAYDYYGIPAAGNMTPEFTNAYWDDLQRSRWTAENGIVRLKAVLGSTYATSVLAAQANVTAGFSNRMVGEAVCFAVIDGGAAQPYAVHFTRAEGYFTDAIALATAINNTSLVQAATAGRASVRASLGKWTEADADAAAIPTNFVYNAVFSLNTSRENNTVNAETKVRYESTSWGTRWATNVREPRVVLDTARDAGGAVAKGRDGKTLVYRQTKYPTLASNIPLAKGTEMLLIRAEKALRDKNVPLTLQYINTIRTAAGLPAATAATEAEAWTLLDYEEAATMWLEARRLSTLRRWNADGKSTFLNGRSKCMPISDKELRTNTNLR